MDKIIQMFSKCKCCCSLRTMAFIHASLELIILAAAVVPLVICILVMPRHMVGFLMVGLSFVVVNFILTSILIHGIRYNSQKIIGGWLWVRVTTMVAVFTTVVLYEVFYGSYAYSLDIWGGLVLSLILATYNVLVIAAHAHKIAAEKKQTSAQDINIPNYGRLQESVEP